LHKGDDRWLGHSHPPGINERVIGMINKLVARIFTNYRAHIEKEKKDYHFDISRGGTISKKPDFRRCLIAWAHIVTTAGHLVMVYTAGSSPRSLSWS
jgi:hypothetical protein